MLLVTEGWGGGGVFRTISALKWGGGSVLKRFQNLCLVWVGPKVSVKRINSSFWCHVMHLMTHIVTLMLRPLLHRRPSSAEKLSGSILLSDTRTKVFFILSQKQRARFLSSELRLWRQFHVSPAGGATVKKR